MKRRPVWQLSVVTTPEAEEAVSECVARLFDEPDLPGGLIPAVAGVAAAEEQHAGDNNEQ